MLKIKVLLVSLFLFFIAVSIGNTDVFGPSGKLSDLTDDVNISAPSNTQILNYNSTSGKWENATLDSANFTGTNWTDLTDSGATTLHSHAGGTGDITGIGDVSSGEAFNGTQGTTLEFISTTTPSTPVANQMKLYTITTQGHTRPVVLDDDGIEFTLIRDNVRIMRNTSGSDMAKGVAVYITGSTGNVPNISLAKADSLTTLPAIGMTAQAITNNLYGNVITLGELMFDTSAFSSGDRLYVSATSAGALTATRPVSPLYAQRMGSVLVSGVGTGSMAVTTAPFIGGEESGTTSNSFAIGDNTNGTKTLTFDEDTANGTLTFNGSQFDLNDDLDIAGNLALGTGALSATNLITGVFSLAGGSAPTGLDLDVDYTGATDGVVPYGVKAVATRTNSSSDVYGGSFTGEHTTGGVAGPSNVYGVYGSAHQTVAVGHAGDQSFGVYGIIPATDKTTNASYAGYFINSSTGGGSEYGVYGSGATAAGLFDGALISDTDGADDIGADATHWRVGYFDRLSVSSGTLGDSTNIAVNVSQSNTTGNPYGVYALSSSSGTDNPQVYGTYGFVRTSNASPGATAKSFGAYGIVHSLDNSPDSYAGYFDNQSTKAGANRYGIYAKGTTADLFLAAGSMHTTADFDMDDDLIVTGTVTSDGLILGDSETIGWGGDESLTFDGTSFQLTDGLDIAGSLALGTGSISATQLLTGVFNLSSTSAPTGIDLDIDYSGATTTLTSNGINLNILSTSPAGTTNGARIVSSNSADTNPNTTGIYASGGNTNATPGSTSAFRAVRGDVDASDKSNISYGGHFLNLSGGTNVYGVSATGATADIWLTGRKLKAGNIVYTFPVADGNSGDSLTTNGTGTLSWAAGGSGANTALSNLAAVAINLSLVSDTANTDDLGSSTIGWRFLYLDDANATNPTTNGQLVYDSGPAALTTYDTHFSAAAKVIPTVLSKSFTIYDPEGITTEPLPLFECSEAITIVKWIGVVNTGTYTMELEERSSTHVLQNDIDSITLDTDGASDTTITDGAIDAGDWVYVDLPTTDVAYISLTVYYYING